MQRLRDRFGRSIHNLRISVTDRCNLRCLYCMPEEGMTWLPRSSLLSFEEIEHLVRLLMPLGIRRIRLTGGEPLVRQDLPELVRRLDAIEGLEDIALTTNGILLPAQAPALAAAGLRRVNVSLDSLVPERFRQITRRDELTRVLQGLRAAAEHFAGPVKVNTVLLRGVNDAELPEFVDLARRRGFVVRFIEFMPLEADDSWRREMLLPGDEIRQRIDRLLPAGVRLMPDPSADARAPSRDWTFSDLPSENSRAGKIGFIDSVTAPFCESCDRIRLTADGKLRTCLFATEETDLLPLLRDPTCDDDAVTERILEAVWNKEPGHKINDADFVRASRTMSQIGG